MPVREVVLAVVLLGGLSMQTRAETFEQTAGRCAPDVHPQTLRKVVSEESRGNPFAVSNWTGAQPASKEEALSAIREMVAGRKGFAIGIAQIWHTNVPAYGHTFEELLEPCANLSVGAKILIDCFRRAPGEGEQQRLRAALSCYNTGNHRDGFRPNKSGTSYVQRVAASAGNVPKYVVPAIAVQGGDAVPETDEAPVRAVAAPKPEPAPWAVFFNAPARLDEAQREAPVKARVQTPLFQTVGGME